MSDLFEDGGANVVVGRTEKDKEDRTDCECFLGLYQKTPEERKRIIERIQKANRNIRQHRDDVNRQNSAE